MDKEEVILEDGRVGYKYPGGEIRDAKGSYLVQPPWAAPTFDSEVGTRAIQHRWDEIRQGAAEGAMIAAEADTERAAASVYTSEQGTLARDTEKGHASTKAAEFVFRAAGWLRPRDSGGVTVQVANVQLPPGVLRALGIDE